MLLYQLCSLMFVVWNNVSSGINMTMGRRHVLTSTICCFRAIIEVRKNYIQNFEVPIPINHTQFLVAVSRIRTVPMWPHTPVALPCCCSRHVSRHVYQLPVPMWPHMPVTLPYCCSRHVSRHVYQLPLFHQPPEANHLLPSY